MTKVDADYYEEHEDEEPQDSYAIGIVNPGESFILLENSWIDWSFVVDFFTAYPDTEHKAFDNLPIKGYVYPWKQIMNIHDLSDWQSAHQRPGCCLPG